MSPGPGLSNRGYGVLWDNTSLSRFGRTEPFSFTPKADRTVSYVGEAVGVRI